MNRRYFAVSFLLITVSVLFSYYFLDKRIAMFFAQIIKSSARLRTYTASIPDLLSEITAVLVVAGWIAHTYLASRGIRRAEARFLHFLGTTLPVAFFFKTLLQQLFGRVTPRLLLFDPDLYGFFWFQGTHRYGHCFPSGHMAVFATIMAAMWHFYPGYRRLYVASISALGVALIVTGYHFLSDVVAGAYLGVVVDGWTYQYRQAIQGNYGGTD
jgi:membrane-associated phospholipid phosphatase